VDKNSESPNQDVFLPAALPFNHSLKIKKGHAIACNWKKEAKKSRTRMCTRAIANPSG